MAKLPGKTKSRDMILRERRLRRFAIWVILAALVISIVVLASMSGSLSSPDTALTASAVVQTNAFLAQQVTQTQIAQAITPTVDPAPCAWNWATEPLDELSAAIQAAVEDDHLTITAVAFGETCFGGDGTLPYFATMETDFTIAIAADDLSETAVESLLREALTIIAAYPPDQTPGPQPGYITITGLSGETRHYIRLPYNQIDEALEADEGTLLEVLKTLE